MVLYFDVKMRHYSTMSKTNQINLKVENRGRV